MQERFHGDLRAESLLDIALDGVFVGRPPVQPDSKAVRRVCGDPADAVLIREVGTRETAEPSLLV